MVQTSHAVHAIQHKKRHPEKTHLSVSGGFQLT